MTTRLLAVLLGVLPLCATPISVQILSGTVTVPGGTSPSGHTANFNVITDTGSLSGFSGAGSAYQDLPVTTLGSLTLDPTLLFGGANASMTILHNGVSYNFQPRDIGSSPDNMRPGSFSVATPITLSPTGPLTFTLPFTAQLNLTENFQFSGATQQDFQFRGSGNATLNFTRSVANTGRPNEFIYRFTGAAFDFISVPEPGTHAAMLIGLAALALGGSRRRSS